ncbi:MAG: methionine gamma-lyase [Acidimicrobiales bacterium]|nr:MAG: methionine gamma-lyase [Acidimicrobiales bacterium]
MSRSDTGGERSARGPRPSLDPETVLIRAGREENSTALAPIVWATTTFTAPTVEEARRMAQDLEETRFYTRYSNPTVRAFERAVAELEGAESARAFASGMGAVSAVVFGICSPGDHVVTQRQLYAGSQMLFHLVSERFGIEVTFVDATQPGAFASAVRPGQTQLVFVETPANPRLDIVDLEEIGSIQGPVRVVDSTFATPLGLRPLEFGVDLVLHSATKGLAGHNDASLGVVAGSRELVSWLRGFAVLQGANASVYDAWSGLRGLRTLGARFERQCRTAELLARELESHPAVSSVRYPGLPSHPQHELAKRQMRAFGGLLTFDLRGGLEAGRAFVSSLRVAQFATSLGGPETLVSHPASTTHVDLTPDELDAAGIGPGTIRVSVGLEHPDDLVADFSEALRACG